MREVLSLGPARLARQIDEGVSETLEEEVLDDKDISSHLASLEACAEKDSQCKTATVHRMYGYGNAIPYNRGRSFYSLSPCVRKLLILNLFDAKRDLAIARLEAMHKYTGKVSMESYLKRFDICSCRRLTCWSCVSSK